MRLLALVATAALAVGSIAGCSGESEPVPAPLPSSITQTPSSPTPTPTETPTETTTPPPMPDAAAGSSRAAAQAFVRYYVDLINYAGTTGDVEDLSAQSAPSCVSCRQLVNTLSDTYANGGYYRTKGWSIETMFLAPEGDDGWTASTEVRASRVRWRTSAGSAPTVAPPQTLSVQFTVQPRGDGWTVTRMTRS